MSKRPDIDQLYTLQKAAEILSPSGEITTKTLRKMIDRGKLSVRRILNRDFVTAADLGEMIEKCRRNPSLQDSGSEKEKTDSPSGSSGTEDDKSQQARTKAIANKLKQPSKATSSTPTKARQADVIPIRSR